MRAIDAELLSGSELYREVVLGKLAHARESVFIATANVKDMHVEGRSITALFSELAGRGVELRILHATPPSRPFRATLARRPGLARALQLRTCPRVHFKTVIVDGAFVYVGSANWTGAGLGAKGTGRRNFELGFAGADDGLLDRVQELFDRIWRGGACKGCRLREVCPAPLDGPRPHSK